MKTSEERFWSHVLRAGKDDCWPWTACINRYGYGYVRVRCKPCIAHRVAYELHSGKAPGRLHVLHKCDNRACCNPRHLYLGTNQDNIDDKMRKGRHRFGEHHQFARLTEQQVREIRRLHTEGNPANELARRFSVSRSTIRDIYLRDSWKHI